MSPKLACQMTPLERAEKVARAFQVSQEALWSSQWPMGHCAVTSLLILPLLRVVDPSWRLAIGLASPERRPHAWCVDVRGAVVDPTYGQFDGGEPLRVLTFDQAGATGHVGRWCIFDLDEEEDLRRSIEPTSGNGWSASSGVRKYFQILRESM